MPCMGTSVKEADRRKEAAERRRKQMQLMQESKQKKDNTDNNNNNKRQEEEEKREVQTENEQRKHHDKDNTKSEKELKDRKDNSKKDNTTTSKVSNKRSSSSSRPLSPQRLPVLVHEQSYYSSVGESRSSKERSEAKREVHEEYEEEEECNSRVSTSVKTNAVIENAVDGGKHNTAKNKNLNKSKKFNSNDANAKKDSNINITSNLENPADRERLMQQMLQQALQLNEMLEHELQDARQKLKDSPGTNATINSSSFTSTSSSSSLIHKPHKSKVRGKNDDTKHKDVHKLFSQGQIQTPRVTICETPSQRSLSAKRENSKQLGKFNNNNNVTKTSNSTTYTKSENGPEALLQRAIREKWSNDEILCKAREAVKHCPPKEAMNTLQILRDVYLLRCKHMAHALERDARKRPQSNNTSNNNNVNSHSPRALSYPVAAQNSTAHHYDYNNNNSKDKMGNNKQTDKIRNNYHNSIENDKHNYYETRPVEPRRGKFVNDYENRKEVNGNQNSYYRSQSAYVPRNTYRDDAEYLVRKRYEPRHESSHHSRNSQQNRNNNNHHHRHHHHHSSSSSYPHHYDSNNYQRYAEDKNTHPSSPYRHYHSEPRQRKSYDDLLQLHSPSYRNNTTHAKYNNIYKPSVHAPAAAERFHRTTHLPNGYELGKSTNIIDSNVQSPYVVRNGLSASQTDIIAALENGYVSQAKRVLAWLEQKVNEENFINQ